MSQLRNQSIYEQGFARVAAASLPVQLADPEANARVILDAARACDAQGAAMIVFPELCITGYSIDDLVAQHELLQGAIRGVDAVVHGSRDISPILIVGAPLELGSALYNCAIAIHRGRILGIQPKEHLPSYHEFYEKRHYSTTPTPLLDPAVQWVRWDHGLQAAPTNGSLLLSMAPRQPQERPRATPPTAHFHAIADRADSEAGEATVPNTDPGQLAEGPSQQLSLTRLIPFGQFQIDVVDVPGLRIALEICEDVWVPVPPSSIAALQGATVIGNLSASPVTVGRARRREELVKAQSSATIGAYVYTAASFGESSNDLSWDGQSLIYENGECLARSPRFQREITAVLADVDLRLIAHQRLEQTTFADNAQKVGMQAPTIVQTVLGASLADQKDTGQAQPEAHNHGAGALKTLLRPVKQFPFVPDDPTQRDADCYEAFNIQSSALVRRMVSIGNPKLVLGVSGGLDSTLALLVAVKAMDSLNRPRTDVVAYTMPGFGTSDRTRRNAEALCDSLGVTFHELDIRPTAEAMLKAMGHPYGKGEPVYDVVFENVQAGLRTDYLFRLAGQLGGIVVGTGDMSELALGWCTYGVGDQMSHYGVNAGLPKTMIQHLIRWVAENEDFAGAMKELLGSILDTEISPELLPISEQGESQSTEAQIGPYELQDFTLYWLLKGGLTPRRIAYLQSVAWGGKYTDREILHWIEVFYRRFFANQFKRTAVPNSPKVMGAGSLSPRGDWRMPSDALSAMWLREINELRDRLERTEEKTYPA